MPPWVDPIPALKLRVAAELLALTEGWTQTYAASFMRLSQSRVSDLRRGNLDRMSLERLLQCLARLGRKIEMDTTRGSGGMVHPHERIDGPRVPVRTRVRQRV